MEIFISLLVITFSIWGRASVLLNDPNNICNETNGSHVLPGAAVTLLCVVNNTGASLNLLVWNTPVSHNRDLSHTTGARYQKNSIFSSTATFNGDLANATLTFTTTESLDNRVVICRDNIAYSKTCTLLIYTIPSIIAGLSNTGVTYRSISLLWNAPSDTGGCNIMNYVITVTPLDGSDPWNISTTDNSTSYTVTGLIFGQSYNFTVTASNSLGVGKESNTVTVTLPGEAPMFIQGIEICFTVSNGNSSLNIYWNCSNAVDANTPPVTNYTINVDGSIIYTLLTDNCPSSDSPYRIQTFNNTQYSINITANNIVGSSIGSNIVIRNLMSITSDIILTGETYVLLRIMITWDSPCIDRVQVIISYYKPSMLSLPQNSSSSYSLNEDVSGKLFFLKNLDPGSEYLYNISMYNGKELVIVEMNKTFNTNNSGMFPTTTQIINVTNTPQLTYISSFVLAVSVSVPITAIVTVIVTTVITFIITYYCCIKSKGGNFSSTTDPPVIYETPVFTSDVSSFEMKDNMAYGHVAIDTGGNIPSATVVYDNVVI